MTAQNDLDRALGAWFGEEDRAAPPPEPLARVIESTRTIRPRPALTAGVGSSWVGAGTTSGVRVGLAGLRPAMIVVAVLLALALAGVALLVGSRLVAPTTPSLTDVSIFVRRDEGPVPGVSVFAVRPDGSEVLVRKVPDSTVPGQSSVPLAGTLSEWGTVSASGWLALGANVKPWPMVLIDLGDEHAKPWVIDDASTGGIGPRWGPTGLVAADAGSNGGRVVIADPKAHTTRIVEMPGGLVGGGPSIVWAADGSGVVSAGNGAYEIVPIDGSNPRPGVTDVFDPSGTFGPGLAGLRICQPGANCPGGDDGRIERVELDGSATTIWQQGGDDRALAASFGSSADEYWLSVDHDKGRQVALVHLVDGRQETVATVNRIADWGYVSAPTEASDGSALMVWTYVGAKPASAAVLVPLHGDQPTYHTGHFAGFVDAAASAAFAAGEPGTTAQTLPAGGEAYALPSLDELIAAELGMNPGRTVLGRASRDAVDGDTIRRTYEVARDKPGAQAYLDCIGPSSVTVTSGSDSTTSPCLWAGANAFTIGAAGPITVSATGDTSWRVVLYSP